jgi:hypothetical protein
MRCTGIARRFKTYHVRDLVLECTGGPLVHGTGHGKGGGTGHGKGCGARERLVRERLCQEPRVVGAIGPGAAGRPMLECLVSRAGLPPAAFSCATARHDVRWVQQLVFQAHHLVRVVFETYCTRDPAEPVVYKAFVEAELDARADRPALAAAVQLAVAELVHDG